MAQEHCRRRKPGPGEQQGSQAFALIGFKTRAPSSGPVRSSGRSSGPAASLRCLVTQALSVDALARGAPGLGPGRSAHSRRARTCWLRFLASVFFRFLSAITAFALESLPISRAHVTLSV
jgi:hypothetical protein